MKMECNDIKQIETALNMNLPDELVKIYTSNLLDGIEDYPRIKGYFIMEPQIIIRINLRLRDKGLWKKPFPKYFFAIGYPWENEYYLVDLRENPLRVFMVKKNKTWAYDPDDLSKNTVHIPPHEGLDPYIETCVLSSLRSEQNRKHREELGIPEPKYTAKDVCEFLNKQWEDIEGQKPRQKNRRQ